jgi:FtsP/CotA-like multicopper oxidase with cupredoxin domain
MKDTLTLAGRGTAEIDFVADNPGDTLFHCHHQDHMDEGFMGLISYAGT